MDITLRTTIREELSLDMTIIILTDAFAPLVENLPKKSS